MAWVENRFKDRLVYQVEVPRLWDRFRDGVGEAVFEFNDRTKGTPNTLDTTNCMARGTPCVRVHKALDNSSVEIFLDVDQRAIMTGSSTGTKTNWICGYRIASGDPPDLELFIESDGVSRIITVDEACEVALGDFIFKPFPSPFINSL